MNPFENSQLIMPSPVIDLCKIGSVSMTYTERDNQGNGFFGERRIEMSLGQWFLNQFSPATIIEVGSTMFNWRPENQFHTVVDLYDYANPKILNVDGSVYDYAGKNVLSISTIEHFDDKQINGVWRTGVEMTDKGGDTIKRIAETASKYLITCPVGIHSRMDELILKADVPRLILKRDANNNWTKDKDNSNTNYKYDNPFPCANAIWVITNLKELHGAD